MDKDLKKKAAAAAIEIEERACSRCKGEGATIYPDPLDLRRWREKHDVNRNRFASSVIKPDGTQGVSVGWLVMVEEADSKKKQQRCPEWLLAEYLRIPEMGIAEPLERTPKSSPESRQQNIQKAIARRRQIFAAKKPKTVKKGQVFRRKGNSFEVVTMVGKKAVIRPRGEEEGGELLVNIATLVKDYEEISREAAA